MKQPCGFSQKQNQLTKPKPNKLTFLWGAVPFAKVPTLPEINQRLLGVLFNKKRAGGWLFSCSGARLWVWLKKRVFGQKKRHFVKTTGRVSLLKR
jgi:hypothetical protein